ncbi:MAG: DHHA1 domain-containing protein [Christensenellales bacterium]|nr:DHHA1 domain-containing protein [Christensenellales bacterium]
MTQRLYYDNAYLTEFEGKVLECRSGEEGFWVRLDRSAFYPTSGGQPHDTGVLLGDEGEVARINDVIVEEGEVWHVANRPFLVGQTVRGRIDWARRLDHMQQHAADHMIAGTLFRRFGGVTIGLHESEEVSTIDVAMPDGATRIGDKDILEVEEEVNRQIQKDVPIRCWFPGAEELETLPLRKKPSVSDHVRIVAIGDTEMVPCGGTHPSSAGQIGLVKITGVAPARGKMRVSFLAGMRAFRDYQACHQAAHRAAALLSAGIDRLPEFVGTLRDQLKETSLELTRLKRERLLGNVPSMIERAAILPDGVRLVEGILESEGGLLRDLVSRLIEAPDVVALLGVPRDGEYAFVFGRSQGVKWDMGALMRQAAEKTGGKGGGRPDFAQGGGSETMLTEAKCLMEVQYSEVEGNQ